MPSLGGSWNFRDVSESTSGAVRAGALFRSGDLSNLDDAGRAELRRLGITDIADLRSPAEVARLGGGQVPDDVEIHLLPFAETLVSADGEAPHEHAFKRLMTEKPDEETLVHAARRFMAEEYRGFAQSAGARHAVQQVITLLAAEHRVLAHCFAGKDRTGFTVAVVLEAAGVARDAVLADYLASNTAAPQLREQIVAMVRRRFDGEIPPAMTEFTEGRLSDDVLGVHDEYLDAAFTSIDDEYGSLDAYLTAAEVTTADLEKLRAALLP
jgi:protein-tyrosine phosphatase